MLLVLFAKKTSPLVNLFNLIFKSELSSFIIGLDFSKIIFEFLSCSSIFLSPSPQLDNVNNNKYKKNLFTEI